MGFNLASQKLFSSLNILFSNSHTKIFSLPKLIHSEKYLMKNYFIICCGMYH